MRRVLILTILALPLLAQQEGQLSLGGMVIDGKTGERFRRALVHIVRFGSRKDIEKGRPEPLARSGFTIPGAHSISTVFLQASTLSIAEAGFYLQRRR